MCVCVCVCVCVCAFTNPSVWAGCDMRSVFKRCLTVSTAEFFFSLVLLRIQSALFI